MTKSESVRSFAVKTYIVPARKRKASSATFRSGDIAKALGLDNRMPLVCSAIDADKFRDECGVRLLTRTGPNQSSTVEWTFSV